jgi:filamin
VGKQKVASIKVPPKLPKAPVKMTITSPSGKATNVPIQDMVDKKAAPFTLMEPGPHQIEVTYGGVPVKDSPWKVDAIPDAGVPKVKAYGPGLTGGEAMKPATFTIDARQETMPGSLGVTVEGPKESRIDVKDNGDGTCGVTYMPEVPGDYKVNVTHSDRPIPGSPFTAKIKPATQLTGPPKVKAYGPGLTAGEATKPAFFTIDTREETRPGGLGVTVEGPKESQIQCTDNGDGTCGVTYMPEVPGDYKINITHAEKPIPGSPFKVKVKPATGGLDVSGVKAYGPGLSPDGNRHCLQA